MQIDFSSFMIQVMLIMITVDFVRTVYVKSVEILEVYGSGLL